jgi:glycosyltransferase involved in cell wall biosynthesis
LKTKICFVVSTGMTVNAFLQQPIKLLSQHYDIYIALDTSTGGSLHGLEDIVTILPVGIKRKISLWQDLVAVFQLLKLFQKHNFKIVHSVTPKAGLLAMLAAALAQIDIRIHTFTGQVWATKSGFGRSVLKKIDKLIGFFCTHILVDSPSQREFLLDERVIAAEKSCVLQKGSISGVDIDRFKPDYSARLRIRESLQIADGDVVFLFIGRLNRDKGILDLAVAFSKIARKHAHAKLLIVGVDEANLLDEILMITEGCEKQVKFIEFTSVPQEYMAASDVLCLPSYREGFGNVIIEAAAVGIPTIGSKIYGITDAVVDGDTGLLFVPRDIKALELCLEKMVENDSLRNSLGVAAHKRACEDFSSQKLSAAWLKYYQELS